MVSPFVGWVVTEAKHVPSVVITRVTEPNIGKAVFVAIQLLSGDPDAALRGMGFQRLGRWETVAAGRVCDLVALRKGN